MHLFENDFILNKTTIRGVRYITASFYGGEKKDIFQKVGELITESFQSSKVPGVPSESLSVLDMDKKGA